MLESVEVMGGPRRSLRREVDVPCHLMSDLWDGAVAHRARDLSHQGVWLDSDFPLGEGERVVIRFRPPKSEDDLYVSGRVARTRLTRRVGDAERSGMAIEFQGVRPKELFYLRKSLRGLPPPVPKALSQSSELLWIEGHELG